jgi:hypothetical protein
MNTLIKDYTPEPDSIKEHQLKPSDIQFIPSIVGTLFGPLIFSNAYLTVAITLFRYSGLPARSPQAHKMDISSFVSKSIFSSLRI